MPSISLSFANTPFVALTVKVVSSAVVLVSGTAIGASLTETTVSVPVALDADTKPWLSVALYWNVVVPFQFAFGLK